MAANRDVWTQNNDPKQILYIPCTALENETIILIIKPRSVRNTPHNYKYSFHMLENLQTIIMKNKIAYLERTFFLNIFPSGRPQVNHSRVIQKNDGTRKNQFLKSRRQESLFRQNLADFPNYNPKLCVFFLYLKWTIPWIQVSCLFGWLADIIHYLAE